MFLFRPSIAAAFALCGALHGAMAAPSKPNLLFMMTDQQRWDTMSLVTPSLDTPNMDRIAKEGAFFKWGYTSTPTCTPARAAILTGQKPWNHGSLGAVGVAQVYPFEMPVTLAKLGYSTTSIGKDHFGWVTGSNATTGAMMVHFDGPDASTCLDGDGSSGTYVDTMVGPGAPAVPAAANPTVVGQGFPTPWGPDVGHGVPHGYQQTSLYDGISAEPDDYHQWFARQMDGKEPESGWPELDMNSWKGEAYAYKNESLHPTAWVGQQAVDFITDRAPFIANASFKDAPWFLKVSFHRPHSPYDPPQRLIDATPLASLRPVYRCAPGDPLGWDSHFNQEASPNNGCGPDKLDAWCGEMPAADSAFARRCYQANIKFIDEWVGKIFDALTASGQLENTYILWAADHGDGQSDHFHWRKGFPYEFASHVPWMMRWPENAVALGNPRAAAWKRGVTIDKAVVELRDVFPTMLDAMGKLNGDGTAVPAGYKMDGDSLLCLLDGQADPRVPSPTSTCRGGKWRPYLDLEHYQVYNETVHWNAVFDGEIKFIFHAFWDAGDPRQFQLFNLTSDPYELQDLARSPLPEHAATLAKYKKVMAQQFLDEGRDKYGFVTADGELLGRRNRTIGATSPNYPRSPSPPGPGPAPGNADCSAQTAAALTAGTAVVQVAGHPPTACEGFTYTEQHSLAVLAVGGHRLCVVPAAGDGLSLAICPGLPAGVPTTAAQFVLNHNNTAAHHAQEQQIVHVSSGKCVTSTTTGHPTLAACHDGAGNAADQLWVFGSSGRFANQNGNLAV